MRSPRSAWSLLLCCLLAVGLLSGCSGADPTVIAVLAADESAQVQQPLDADGLEQRVAEVCDGCRVEVYDAGSDADAQAEQLEQALAESADFVILDPVDPELAEALVEAAGETPVLAFGALVPGADWFVGLAEQAPPEQGITSDLEAAREVVLGDRKSFTFVPARAMSFQAADVAVGELANEPVEGSEDFEGVPSWLYSTTEVRLPQLTSVLVRQGVVTLDDLCSDATARRCERLGFV